MVASAELEERVRRDTADDIWHVLEEMQTQCAYRAERMPHYLDRYRWQAKSWGLRMAMTAVATRFRLKNDDTI